MCFLGKIQYFIEISFVFVKTILLIVLKCVTYPHLISIVSLRKPTSVSDKSMTREQVTVTNLSKIIGEDFYLRTDSIDCLNIWLAGLLKNTKPI